MDDALATALTAIAAVIVHAWHEHRVISRLRHRVVQLESTLATISGILERVSESIDRTLERLDPAPKQPVDDGGPGARDITRPSKADLWRGVWQQ